MQIGVGKIPKECTYQYWGQVLEVFIDLAKTHVLDVSGGTLDAVKKNTADIMSGRG